METRTIPNYLNDPHKRQRAIDWISRLVDDELNEGRVPQPSAMGLPQHDDPEGDPVYDWAQSIIEEIDEGLQQEKQPTQSRITEIRFYDADGDLVSKLPATPDLLVLIGLMEAGCTHEIRHLGNTLLIFEQH